MCLQFHTCVVLSIIYTVSVEGEAKLASKSIKWFSLLFCTTLNAEIEPKLRLWKSRGRYIQSSDQTTTLSSLSMTRNAINLFKRVNLKAMNGRGRNRAPCVEMLHQDVQSYFDRPQKLGVKFNYSTLCVLFRNPLFERSNGIYGKPLIDNFSRKGLEDMLTTFWVQSFANRFQIVHPKQPGKLKLSTEKLIEFKIEPVRHLGLKKSF